MGKTLAMSQTWTDPFTHLLQACGSSFPSGFCTKPKDKFLWQA
jgi:hypothetical protein